MNVRRLRAGVARFIGASHLHDRSQTCGYSLAKHKSSVVIRVHIGGGSIVY